jgi:subtilisin family serine protease/subtilisin-like proprotein convertase family protein
MWVGALAAVRLFVVKTPALLLAAVIVSPAWLVIARPGPLADPPSRLAFREPEVAVYVLDTALVAARSAASPWADWLPARRDGGGTNLVWFGSRVVVQLNARVELTEVMAGSPLELARVVGPGLYVLQASDARIAAAEAMRLAARDGVEVSHPVRRRPAGLHSGYAPAPNDPLFGWQWHLENRDTNTAARLGFDLNLRAAWADNRGAGVVVAMGDNGVELSHPDLAAGVSNPYHYNFVSGVATGNPVSSSQAHGTCVAGLIAARNGNQLGVSGVAPAVQLASWVIFDAFDGLATEEAVMDMFQYRSNVVSVQNHSWGNADVQRLPISVLEAQGVNNALEFGRGGRGVVIVRAAGNQRTHGNDLNDDGYGLDPRVIAVGAVRANGRATSYTTPGAPVLVAAFSGDDAVARPDGSQTNYPTLTTTDRQGNLGYNASIAGGLADYAYNSTGFSGTSGATPQIAGLCALILGANPNLTYRDVQIVLLLAARQLDAADPGIRSNAAGFAFSHSVGFGVPDAGLAVQLARGWSNRPALASVTAANRQSASIPDDGLRVRVTGPGVPAGLLSIPAYPSDGLHPDDPTPALPLVDVGQALAPIGIDLTGRAALIQRGVNYFVEKIQRAAAAGAAFAVVFNNVGTAERVYMSGADIQFAPIPAVFIDRTSGEALRTYLAAQPSAQAQLKLDSAAFTFEVTTPLSVEYVRLHVRASHSRRADVRITLLSPGRSRSVLHHFNQDTYAASSLGEWDYYSRVPFGESSRGTWTAEVSDEVPGSTGSITSMALTVYGVAMTDDDRDGLDDDWERLHFGDLAAGPSGDPDADGFSNVREFILGWDPVANNRPLQLDIVPWSTQRLRLSWPAAAAGRYELLALPEAGGPPGSVVALPGVFPESEWFVPTSAAPHQFFEVREYPVGPGRQ